MPIIRKLMKVGVDSKAVVLPKSWIDEIAATHRPKSYAVNPGS
jgi:hypothetical protein